MKKRSKMQLIFFVIACILFAVIIWLLIYWYDNLYSTWSWYYGDIDNPETLIVPH
jgi:hypothetical protein